MTAHSLAKDEQLLDRLACSVMMMGQPDEIMQATPSSHTRRTHATI